MATGISPQETEYELMHISDDKSPAIIAGSVVLIVSSTIAVILRLLARRIKLREVRGLRWGADDVLIVVALVCAWCIFGAIAFATQHGLGKHVLRVGLPEVSLAVEALYVYEALYPACCATMKLSVLLLYRRIFTTQNRCFAYAIYTIAIVLMGLVISSFFATTFECWPVEDLWTRIDGSCYNYIRMFTIMAAINAAINASVLIVPIPMVWGLQMPLRRRIAVCSLFVLGSCDVMISIVRTYQTTQVTFPVTDILWVVADTSLLGLAEPCIGIVCACLPVMPPLFNRIFGGKTSSSGSQRSSSSKQSLFRSIPGLSTFRKIPEGVEPNHSFELKSSDAI